MGETTTKKNNTVGYWFCNLAFVLEDLAFIQQNG